MKAAKLTIAGKEYGSRLIIGTGKYPSFGQTRRALDASGAEIITVAVRRVNVTDPTRENLLDALDLSKVTILPNTAGCTTAAEAGRTAGPPRTPRSRWRCGATDCS